MYELKGWTLFEVNSTRMQFVQGKLRVEVITIYPTFMADGKQVIQSWIDKHKIGEHKTIAEALHQVSSNEVKWFDRGYRKGCQYLVDHKSNYNYWMEYYNMTEEENDRFDEGWSKSHDI